jgi:DNA-binding transcriptional ArsR family regulator/uncharacterized protein YndB with AHSA1/START domain
MMGTRDTPSSAGRTSVQAIVDALSSPVRREILWLVWDTERSAGEIAASFDLTPGTISSHLSALRGAGLLEMRRDGTFRRYRADRSAMEAVLPLLGSSDDKWNVADDIPERKLAHSGVQQWVSVGVEVPITREEAFASFTDGSRFSDFLGVPVSIEDGRFSARLEWGTRVRGRYEVVAPPDLIAMRWDFDDDAIPVPGRQLVAYLRFDSDPSGCRVEVHQVAADPAQAEFLSVAWSLVLGRLVEHTAHLGEPQKRRRARPKHLGDDAAPTVRASTTPSGDPPR